jgi:hypothetical protein
LRCKCRDIRHSPEKTADTAGTWDGRCGAGGDEVERINVIVASDWLRKLDKWRRARSNAELQRGDSADCRGFHRRGLQAEEEVLRLAEGAKATRDNHGDNADDDDRCAESPHVALHGNAHTPQVD